MIKIEIFENIKKKSLSYDEKLFNFIKIYLSYIEKLDKLAKNKREVFLKEKFLEWFEENGYMLILDGISYLDENDLKRFNAFCNIYCFYLNEGKNDIDKLLDFLYTIPTQLEKDFFV